MANDPHVGSLIPSLFYVVELVLLHDNNTVRHRVLGAMPDGMPTFPLGVTEYIAWGSTAAYVDNKDVYYETIRNDSGRVQYLFKDEWKDFR